jgi:hypothetical protein
VAELDAAHGRPFDAASQRISASLLVLAKQNNLSRGPRAAQPADQEQPCRREHLHRAGDRNDPGHRRASIATEVAAKTDVADSLRLKEQ